MIRPWEIGAVQRELVLRPGDSRLREALCLDEPDCAVCGGRLLISDCEACGLDVPPYRFVFAMTRDADEVLRDVCHHCGHNARIERWSTPIGDRYLCKTCGAMGFFDDEDAPYQERVIGART